MHRFRTLKPAIVIAIAAMMLSLVPLMAQQNDDINKDPLVEDWAQDVKENDAHAVGYVARVFDTTFELRTHADGVMTFAIPRDRDYSDDLRTGNRVQVWYDGDTESVSLIETYEPMETADSELENEAEEAWNETEQAAEQVAEETEEAWDETQQAASEMADEAEQEWDEMTTDENELESETEIAESDSDLETQPAPYAETDTELENELETETRIADNESDDDVFGDESYDDEYDSLPATAGSLPTFALIGLVLIGLGFGLRWTLR